MKTVLFTIIAIAITLGAIIYQRSTGPTYPKKVSLAIEDETYKFKLIRSHGGTTDCPLEFEIPNSAITGTVTFKKFPTRDEWTTIDMVRDGNQLIGYLPNQPPAGKLEYKIEFQMNDNSFPLHETNATVIRFKGDVPALALVPHVLLMFIAMLLSNLVGVMALFKHGNYRRLAWITFILFGLGGMVLGPVVQWYAFGEFWAGIPFAWDLTDNKTLVAFIFWIIALVMNRQQPRPAYIVLASVVMLIIYSIPHSMYGSQLDPETGEIIQASVRWIGFRL